MEQNWLLGVRRPMPVQGKPTHPAAKQQSISQGAFQAELDKQLAPPSVIVSQHAKQRLEKRDIRLNDTDFKQIGDAISRMAAKGGRESLILYKDTALVVNVQNRTIITAVDQQSLQEHVFTNIDSAMIL